MMLSDNLAMVYFDEDLTGAFYLLALPPSWLKFQALNMPVRGFDVGDLVPELAKEPTLYPAVGVIAMGWASACGVL